MRLAAQPNFKTYKIISENLVLMYFDTTSIKYDKFNYIGFTVLELSKLIIYKFVYEFLYKNYNHEQCTIHVQTQIHYM